MSEFPRQRANGLVIKETVNEIYIYDEYSYFVHTLNATGARVWNLCLGNLSVEDIAKAADLGEGSLTTFLNKLNSLELIEGYTTRSI